MRFLWEFFSRVLTRAPRIGESASQERRRATRQSDDRVLDLVGSKRIQLSQVQAARVSRGRQFDQSGMAAGTILDLSPVGLRFRSRQAYPVSRRLFGRLDLATGPSSVGMKVVWSRPTPSGYEYGATYTPVVTPSGAASSVRHTMVS